MSDRYYLDVNLGGQDRTYFNPIVPTGLLANFLCVATMDAALFERTGAFDALVYASSSIEADLTAPMNLAADLLCGQLMTAELFSNDFDNQPPVVSPVQMEIVFVEGIAGVFQIVATDPDLDPLVFDKNAVPLPPGVTLNTTLGRYEYDGSLWGLTEDVVTEGHIVYADDLRADNTKPPRRLYEVYSLGGIDRIYTHIESTALAAFLQCGTEFTAGISSDILLRADLQCTSELTGDFYLPNEMVADIMDTWTMEAELGTEIQLAADMVCSADVGADLPGSPSPIGTGTAKILVRSRAPQIAVRSRSARVRIR